MQHQHLKELLEKFNDGTISDAEMQELDAWYTSLNKASDSELFDLSHPGTSQLTDQRLTELKARLNGEATPMFPAKRIRPFRWFRRIAVAVVGIALFGGAYVFLKTKKPAQTVVALQQQKRPTHDVSPGSSTALLTLADGSRIPIDSIGSGSLSIRQNNNLIRSASGELIYNTATPGSNAIEYNTLFVPKGSKVVHVTLSDGTQVWLNSFSSLRYPVMFSGSERKVEIMGEAYFEVAKNAERPFIVQKDDMQVKVLGTHFNVNSYADETHIKVTLLEGSVKINNAGSSKLIIPGEQAALSANGAIAITPGVDLDEVMAWKNGRFEFTGQTIGQIMRQVERWYDVQVKYKGKVPNDHFIGDVSRMENVSEVLKMLEHTGVISFTIENKTITVSGK